MIQNKPCICGGLKTAMWCRGIFLGTVKMNCDLIIGPCCLARAANWNCRLKPFVSFAQSGRREVLVQRVSVSHCWKLCMSTKQQDFSHNRRERDCFVSLQLAHPIAVKTLSPDMLNKRGQVVLRSTISVNGSSGKNRLKWEQILLN